VSETLSVVLTTLNEERNVDRCLGSVAWADEIVVVDSFSRDATVERARRYTTRVYQHEYPGSSAQVERGIRYATGDWVLVIDADEEVTPELAGEIRQVLRNPAARNGAVGYDIPRKVNAFGRWLVGGGWYPDYQFRLFRKDSYRAEHQEVHGGFAPTGPRGRLSSFLLHYTYETIHDYVAKINDYTSLHVANILKERPDADVSWHKLILSPLSHFLRMFVSKKGYRDGFYGFVLALLDAVYALLLYAKLWEYRMRQRSGGDFLPPISNAELTRRKRL
jgi:glycosyltransferase involved in cell wall biosynthesis